MALLCGFLIVVVNILVKPIRVRRTPEDELETTVKSGLFLRNRLIFDGGFDGGFVNFGDGFYSYTIFLSFKKWLIYAEKQLDNLCVGEKSGVQFPSPPPKGANPNSLFFVKHCFGFVLIVEEVS